MDGVELAAVSTVAAAAVHSLFAGHHTSLGGKLDLVSIT